LKKTTLILGQVNGSVLLDDCSDCVIKVSCHQFRMHRAKNTQVYLDVKSTAVIEECRDISFSSYNGGEAEFEVEDFDLIGTDAQSPNWHHARNPVSVNPE